MDANSSVERPSGGASFHMKISKRSVDALQPRAQRYIAWDDSVTGFGVRVEPSGRKTFICRYRIGTIRRQYMIGRYDVLTPDQARACARRILGSVALGSDPAGARQDAKSAIRLCDLVQAFLEGHGPKLKRTTRTDYQSAFIRHVTPVIGQMRAVAVTTRDLNRIHLKLRDRPYRANRVIAYVGSVYSWAAKNGYVPDGFNPAKNVKRFREENRTRYLSNEELERLGAALRLAETAGLPWNIQVQGDLLRHVPKTPRQEVYPRCVTGAIRLLLFTGCRLREILNLRWDEVDLDRGLLFLPDTKTGRKTIILNGAAVAILSKLDRLGPFVVPGLDLTKPRHDLKRPWEHIRLAAGLNDVRLHDLRHTYASIGVNSGFGLPVLGRLLGHASPMTTHRYAHLADDPARRASEAIGNALIQTLEPTSATA